MPPERSDAPDTAGGPCGPEIPLAAEHVRIADAFDAMTQRPAVPRGECGPESSSPPVRSGGPVVRRRLPEALARVTQVLVARLVTYPAR